MKWLKAITTDGDTVYFNPAEILTITPRKCGDVTVLMGAGMYWHIKPETMIYVDGSELIGELMEG